MNYTPLHYIYKDTQKPGAPTLLLLHGTGGDENDLIPLAEELNTGFNLLSVRGNVNENGMNRFFRRLGMGLFDEHDLAFRSDELVHFLKAVAVKEGFNPDKLIALGYSNGANIAGALLVRNPGLLAGAILYRPMQPFKTIAPSESVNNIPLLITSGALDPTVRNTDTEQYTDTLKKMGYIVAFHALNTGHNLINEDLELAKAWLSDHF